MTGFTSRTQTYAWFKQTTGESRIDIRITVFQLCLPALMIFPCMIGAESKKQHHPPEQDDRGQADPQRGGCRRKSLQSLGSSNNNRQTRNHNPLVITVQLPGLRHTSLVKQVRHPQVIDYEGPGWIHCLGQLGWENIPLPTASVTPAHPHTSPGGGRFQMCPLRWRPPQTHERL